MAENEQIPLKSRIRTLHVGRVYNLGNYENLRIELTVDVGTEDDPAKVLRAVQRILGDLRAKPNVDGFELQRAKAALATPEAELSEYEREKLPRYQEVVDKWKEAMARRKAAAAALSTLEYTYQHKDHKEDWDENYEDEWED